MRYINFSIIINNKLSTSALTLQLYDIWIIYCDWTGDRAAHELLCVGSGKHGVVTRPLPGLARGW